MTKITFRIDAEGGVTLVDAEGFGQNCQSATSSVVRRLGQVQDGSQQLTENYQQQVGVNVTQGAA